MKFAECVNNVSTFIDLKRLANEYVIDYKRLSGARRCTDCESARNGGNDKNGSAIL